MAESNEKKKLNLPPWARRLINRWPILLIIIAVGAILINKNAQAPARNAQPAKNSAYPEKVDESPLHNFNVINAHEHLMSRKFLPKYFDACQQTGIVKTLFVASSDYTIKGAGDKTKQSTETEPVGVDRQKYGNDENNAELIAAAKEFPDRIVPFCTIHPDDPQKLDKIKAAVAAGAKGLKLYTGHSNFYAKPLDDPEMMPVYKYCEETRLPICWHVNCQKYLSEFEHVMQQCPKLVVIVPHFGVTFFHPGDQTWQAFERLMDTYPGMYTDTSFGTREILISGLEAVNRDPQAFKDFFAKYSDRVLFGTDMVITGNREKTTEWIGDVIRACRNVLEKDSYKCAMGASTSKYASKNSTNTDGYFRGLNLDDETLKKVYETNFQKLFTASSQ